MLLSILIPTVPGRASYLEKCLAVLKPQLTDDVEILILSDNATRTIGTKRNCLLAKAKGKYCCFVDDDDIVAPNYIEAITEVLKAEEVDAVGFWLARYVDGKEAKGSKHSAEFSGSGESRDYLERAINHLNPVRTKLARKVGFKHISFGEDTDYAVRLHPLLKKTAFIDQKLYTYLFRNAKPELPKPNVTKV